MTHIYTSISLMQSPQPSRCAAKSSPARLTSSSLIAEVMSAPHEICRSQKSLRNCKQGTAFHGASSAGTESPCNRSCGHSKSRDGDLIERLRARQHLTVMQQAITSDIHYNIHRAAGYSILAIQLQSLSSPALTRSSRRSSRPTSNCSIMRFSKSSDHPSILLSSGSGREG